MREFNWIVDVLIDLNTFCERQGFEELSTPLVAALEVIAPILNGGNEATDRLQVPLGRVGYLADSLVPPRPANRPQLRLVTGGKL